MTTPDSCVTSQNVDHDNLMTPTMEIYADLLKKKYKVEDQLVIISETLLKMEVMRLESIDKSCVERVPKSVLSAMSTSLHTIGAIKSYHHQAQHLVKNYLLADPFIPYTFVLTGIFLCKVVYDLCQVCFEIYV